MKTLLVSASLLWVLLAMELAWPSALPHGALLLPLICGLIFWTRSTSGLLLSGLVLLLDWIARPSQLPLCPMGLPFLAVICLAPSVHHEEYRSRGFSLSVPVPLQLPLLTLAAMLLQILGSIPPASFATPLLILPDMMDSLKSLAIIALPLSAGVSLVIRLADELGLTRSFVI